MSVATAQLQLDGPTLDAIAERVVDRLRGGLVTEETLSCADFAARINRRPKWVQARCRTGRINTVAGGPPYRIPASELQRMIAGGSHR